MAIAHIFTIFHKEYVYHHDYVWWVLTGTRNCDNSIVGQPIIYHLIQRTTFLVYFRKQTALCRPGPHVFYAHCRTYDLIVLLSPNDLYT